VSQSSESSLKHGNAQGAFMPQGVSKTRTEVKDLQRLRQLFLEAPTRGGLADYWQDDALLELYDNTYARRIGWKWQAVIGELIERRWSPPAQIRRWTDWGCGSGVAAETLLSLRPDWSPPEIICSDRSQRARAFSARKLSSHAPSARVSAHSPDQLNIGSADLVLVSHVLTEISSADLQNLLNSVRSASALIWVEPGIPLCSQRLIQVRKELSDDFEVVAPCPHSSACPLDGKERDWCHFFAPPPAGLFQDADWTHLARELGIDLRSLPVSFLVLQRRQQTSQHVGQASGKNRLLARPRYYKGHAKVLLCEADGGLAEKQLQQRHFKQEFKDWQKDCFFVEITSDPDCG
jgi:ribosomal protein RSM22 (predicted rRNA methylase)